MRRVRSRILEQSLRTNNKSRRTGERQMKTRTISLAVFFALSAAAMVMPSPMTAGAQTQNQTSKFQITESFTFPNECTNEVMDVADTTTVTCHDQQRADGTFSEKCEIRQDVTATGNYRHQLARHRDV